MATEVTIDSTVRTTAAYHNGVSPTTVFISDQTGYTFYIDFNGSCVYRKTTDGGVVWGSPVTVDSQTDCLGVGIWYDRWTPSDSTGTFVHIVTFDSGSDDLWYTRLDTSNDALTSTVNATGASQSGSYTAGANLPSITKSTDGILYIGIQDGSDSFVIKSADGSVWTEAGTNPFDLTDDFLILMPLSGGNIMAIRWDVSADDIQSKVFNGSTWDAGWTNIDTSAADNATYDAAFGATVDKTTGNIYLTYAADIVTLGTNDDIRTALYANGTWTSKSNVLTNDTKGITGAKISFDENTGDVYVIYSAQTTAGTANTGNIYWAKSTDKMTTWNAEQGPVNTTADDIYGARVNSMSNERIYVTWYGATPDALFGDTIADLIPPLPPTPPPRVVLTVDSTTPTNGATGVAVNTTISAIFSLFMNGSTLTTDTFQLIEGGKKVSGAVTTHAETATFTPLADLKYNTIYTAKVTTGAQASNYAGTTLDNDYTWSFATTGDSGPPIVSSTSPPNGAAGVTTNSVITATFSEAMQAATINTNTFTVSDGKGNIGGTVSYIGTTATFTPLSSFSDSTTYTARITNGVKDLAGNAMASDYRWSFTTVDITTPIVSSTSPPNGAAGVTTNSVITATFSEAMQAATINTNTFTVSDGKGNIGGTVSYIGITATFTPLSNFSDSTTYTARITNGVKDLAGNAMASDYRWSFTTVDITTPIVSSMSPPNGAAGVTTNSVVTATFSEAIQASTINTNTFTVSDGKGNIGGTVSYIGITATFTPLSNFSDSTTYTARITNGVKDLAGNAMASDYTWSFMTGDFTAPMVVTMNPFNGATGVAITSIITVTFSEAMQSSTINTNTFTVSDGKGNIGGTVSYIGATATFTPLSNLSDSTTYTARITTSARDVAGNMLISDHTWSFTTIDTTSPKVISTNPINGAAGVAINSAVTVSFSEAMLASSINTNTFIVSAGSKNIRGTVLYNGATATFLPSDNLSHSTIYTARITTGMMDLAFNEIVSDYTWNFVTTGDFIAPTIIATSPVNGDADVAINRSVTVTFSEVMQLSTITTDTFSVSDDKGKIGGTVSCHGATAIFTPLNNLLTYTAYKARITTGARDLAGNALASPYTWSFETSGDIDNIAPKVILTSPVNGTAGVEVSSVVTATFSEMIDATDVTKDTFLVDNGHDTINGIVSYNQTTATFTPLNNLSSYIIHTARITKGIKDLAGNPMISDYTWSFTTTGDFAAPTVMYTSPANGAAGVNVGSAITATFSEMMDASTLVPDTYIINNGSNDIGGVISYRDKTVTFTPNIKLNFNTIYTATINTGARDIAGNPIASAYTWSFTTELVSDTPTPGHTETPIPTPTVSPAATPLSTPTPSGCSTEKIKVFPEKMQIERGEIDIVTVTVTGANDCPAKGETIRAKITEGKRRIVVSPQFSITNKEGQAVFTITALNNTGRATVKFKSGSVKTGVKVKIVE